MSNAVAQCIHVKTNGEVCGSPAVSGTEFCYHHSAVKTALAKAQSNGKVHSGGFAPIPFVFPEDWAAMQINFFLLLQAYNEQRIDQRTYNSFLAVLRSMARNLGKTGRLTENSEEAVSEPTSQKRDPSTSSGQVVGHPRRAEGNSGKAISKTNGLESLADLKASAIAPESSFSKKPSGPTSESYRDVFRVSTLDLAMQGPRQAAEVLPR